MVDDIVDDVHVGFAGGHDAPAQVVEDGVVGNRDIGIPKGTYPFPVARAPVSADLGPGIPGDAYADAATVHYDVIGDHGLGAPVERHAVPGISSYEVIVDNEVASLPAHDAADAHDRLLPYVPVVEDAAGFDSDAAVLHDYGRVGSVGIEVASAACDGEVGYGGPGRVIEEDAVAGVGDEDGAVLVFTEDAEGPPIHLESNSGLDPREFIHAVTAVVLDVGLLGRFVDAVLEKERIARMRVPDGAPEVPLRRRRVLARLERHVGFGDDSYGLEENHQDDYQHINSRMGSGTVASLGGQTPSVPGPFL